MAAGKMDAGYDDFRCLSVKSSTQIGIGFYLRVQISE